MQWPWKVAKKISSHAGSCILYPPSNWILYQLALSHCRSAGGEYERGAMFNVTGSSLSLKTLREAVHNQKVTKSYGHFH